MSLTSQASRAGRRRILHLAWPIVVANSAVPLLGLADTAVIGNTGAVVDLGAIALGALIFNFLYWSFGFLRMGTTGFTAQASGAGDEGEVRATLGRALLMAAGIGVALVIFQVPITWLALELLTATPETEELSRTYVLIRIWGAPASLGVFAILGTFVGLGRTDQLLKTQLFLNGLNLVLDILLGGVFGLGVRGIALGTAIAEWATLGMAFLLVRTILSERAGDDVPFWSWAQIRDSGKVVQTLGANWDIMLRTLLLLLGFGWFTNLGAQLGDVTLAANHVLLQLVTLSAYLLDGFANATEILVGRAVGARERVAFDQSVRSATELAAASALGLAVGVLVFGPSAVAVLTDLTPVRDTAVRFMPWTAAYVATSFAAFQLDGIFIGATATRDMRNASILSLLSFLALSLLLTPRFENTGLWAAFVLFVIARAVSLGVRYPRVRASVGRAREAAT